MEPIKWTTVYERPSKLRTAVGVALLVLFSISMGVMMWAAFS